MPYQLTTAATQSSPAAVGASEPTLRRRERGQMGSGRNAPEDDAVPVDPEPRFIVAEGGAPRTSSAAAWFRLAAQSVIDGGDDEAAARQRREDEGEIGEGARGAREWPVRYEPPWMKRTSGAGDLKDGPQVEVSAAARYPRSPHDKGHREGR